MIFLVLLGINAATYQVVFYPRMPQWDAGGTPSGAKFCAVLSLIVWIGIMVLRLAAPWPINFDPSVHLSGPILTAR